MNEKKETWKTILNLISTIISAICAALCSTSCIGINPFNNM